MCNIGYNLNNDVNDHKEALNDQIWTAKEVQDCLRTLAIKYGLIREFKENAIILKNHKTMIKYKIKGDTLYIGGWFLRRKIKEVPAKAFYPFLLKK